MAVSLSIPEQLQQQYLDAADWKQTGDTAKAKQFVTVCTKILGVRPESSTQDGISISFNFKAIENQMQEAERFVESGTAKRHEGFRMYDFSKLRD